MLKFKLRLFNMAQRRSERVPIPSRGMLYRMMSTEEGRINTAVDEAVLDSAAACEAQLNAVRASYGRYEEFSRMQERRLGNPANREERHDLKCHRSNMLHRVNTVIGNINEVGTQWGLHPNNLYQFEERPSLVSALEARSGARRVGEYFQLDGFGGSEYEWSSEVDEIGLDENYVPPRDRNQQARMSRRDLDDPLPMNPRVLARMHRPHSLSSLPREADDVVSEPAYGRARDAMRDAVAARFDHPSPRDHMPPPPRRRGSAPAIFDVNSVPGSHIPPRRASSAHSGVREDAEAVDISIPISALSITDHSARRSTMRSADPALEGRDPNGARRRLRFVPSVEELPYRGHSHPPFEIFEDLVGTESRPLAREPIPPVPAPRTIHLDRRSATLPDRRREADVRPFEYDRAGHAPYIEGPDMDRGYRYAPPLVSEVNSAQFLARLELAKEPAYKFDGERDRYINWAMNIQRKMNLAGLDGADRLQVLQNNTTSKAKWVVDTFANVIILSPSHAEENFREAWKALEERFGSKGHQVDNVRRHVRNFVPITSEQNWFEIGRLKDICKMLQSAMRCSDRTEAGLEKYNRREGLLELAMKLPTELRKEWHSYGHYVRSIGGSNIGIQTFIQFLELEYDKLRDDFFRGLTYAEEEGTSSRLKSSSTGKGVSSRPYTSAYHSNPGDGSVSKPVTTKCAFDESHDHYTGDCPNFQSMEYQERKEYLGKKGLCYVCTGHHLSFKCNVRIRCDVCKRRHHTSLHRYPVEEEEGVSVASPPAEDGSAVTTGGARADSTHHVACTPTKDLASASSDDETLCKFSMSFLVEIGHDDREEVVECIAMLDCHSWRTFCLKELADKLRLPTPHVEYDIGTLASFSTFVKGHSVDGLKIRNPNGGDWVRLPTVYTNEFIPEVRAKRATREIVERVDHLAHLAQHFQRENKNARTLLLLGEDVQDLFQITSHGREPPYAQETSLGWALVGSVPRDIVPQGCLAKEARTTKSVCVVDEAKHESFIMSTKFLPRHERLDDRCDVFQTRPDDEETTWSRDDDEFIQVMKKETRQDEDGALELPLPFRKDRQLPRNETPVYYRTQTVLDRIQKDPTKLGLCREAMQKYIDRGHVEMVPPGELKVTSECCWLPIFAVMHPRKPAVRLVFDASAKFHGRSLNDALYSGPDLNNSLRGVLLRFRTHTVVFSFDIEHMFNRFRVPSAHRDYLRFFWWADNDPEAPIAQFRSLVHLFGACSSPAVAMFALRTIAAIGKADGRLSEDEAAFLDQCFYIDDGMSSRVCVEEVTTLVERVIPYLRKYGLKAHKILSNSEEVLDALGEERGMEKLAIPGDDLVPRALGVTWDTAADDLHVLLDLPERPFTRRGLLATTNTAFDPLGIAAPVLLGSRLQQRKILSEYPPKCKVEWDEPLPDTYIAEWKEWLQGVAGKRSLRVPRCLLPLGTETIVKELHMFADASEDAIGCVAYVRSADASGRVEVRFLVGHSKVAPRAATTVPRLELCAVLLAAITAYELLKEFSNIQFDEVFFYTDSEVVLGYLGNKTRSFTKYVTRRVEAVHRLTKNKEWKFISTDRNPADIATRPHTVEQLLATRWLTGPEFLHQISLEFEPTILPTQTLPETITCEAHVCTIQAPEEDWVMQLVKRRSKWRTIVNVVRIIVGGGRAWLDRARQRLKVELAVRCSEIDYRQAELCLFRASQRNSFPEVYNSDRQVSLDRLKNLPERHPLLGLTPFKGADGVLRIGGRLRNCSTPFEERYPIILEGKSLVAVRFAEYVHERTLHQGRVITYSSIRQAGVFILGGKKRVSKLITECVMCRRLRGPTVSQLMGELPEERVTQSDVFDHIGVDVFGPFYVHDGRSTRRTVGTKKVFVLLVNCLASRAIHLEPLESMDTSAMMNALRRFFSLRGLCKSITSDHGSNFLGVLGQSNHFQNVKREVEARGITWHLNPVGASHYGGAYERKIGSVRRVLESYLMIKTTPVSRDELHTYLQEAAAIVNSTPLYVTYDEPDEPTPISPQMLLTLKSPASQRPMDEDIVADDVMAYGARRWRRVQALANAFWDHWARHYLQELTMRQKWMKVKRNFQSGDVVILKEKNLPRCSWRLAVVQDALPGKDSFVRRVNIRLLGGRGKVTLSERAVTDLVLLHSPPSS